MIKFNKNQTIVILGLLLVFVSAFSVVIFKFGLPKIEFGFSEGGATESICDETCYGSVPWDGAGGYWSDPDLVLEGGSAWVNYPIEWAGIEGIKGTYNWKLWDNRVNIISEKGIGSVAIIFGVPKWASSDPKCYTKQIAGKATIECPDNTYRFYPPKPEYYPDYERYVKALVGRYKERIHYWKIHHELTDKWEVNPGTCYASETLVKCEMRQMVEMLSHAYKAIKEADPQAIVLSPSHGHSKHWLVLAEDFTKAFLSSGACNYFDMFDIHYYDPAEDVPWMINSIKNTLGAFGCQKDLWQTETGMTSDDDIAIGIADLYTQDPLYYKGRGCNSDFLGPGERLQAKDLEKKLPLLTQLGIKGVGNLNLFDYPNQYNTGNVEAFEFHCNLGLYIGELTNTQPVTFRRIRPKLGFCSYQKVALGEIKDPWCKLYEHMIFADSFYALKEIGLNKGIYSGITLTNGTIRNGVLINGLDYLKYPTKNNFDFDVNKGTIELWVKPSWDSNTMGNHRVLFSTNSGSTWTSQNHIYLVAQKNKFLNFVVYDSNGISHSVATPINWSANQWHHIAIVWDFTSSRTSEMLLYIDGLRKGNNYPTNPGLFNLNFKSAYFYIGSSFERTFQFNGVIDEIKIFDHPRKNTPNNAFYLYRCGNDVCDGEEDYNTCPTDCKL